MQPIRFRLILAALGLALAAPVTAQETAAPAEQTSPAAPADRRPPRPAPSAAAPAPEAPAPAAEAPQGTAPAEGTAPAAGTVPASEPAANGAAAPGANGAGNPAKPEVMEIVRDTFGDWQVRCAPDGKECFMYQLALDQEKNPVAEVSILKLPEQAEAAAGVTVVTPLGTLLAQRRRGPDRRRREAAVPLRLVQPGRLLLALRARQAVARLDEARQGRQDHPGLGRQAPNPRSPSTFRSRASPMPSTRSRCRPPRPQALRLRLRLRLRPWLRPRTEPTSGAELGAPGRAA